MANRGKPTGSGKNANIKLGQVVKKIRGRNPGAAGGRSTPAIGLVWPRGERGK